MLVLQIIKINGQRFYELEETKPQATVLTTVQYPNQLLKSNKVK